MQILRRMMNYGSSTYIIRLVELCDRKRIISDVIANWSNACSRILMHLYTIGKILWLVAYSSVNLCIYILYRIIFTNKVLRFSIL